MIILCLSDLLLLMISGNVKVTG